MRSHVAQSDEDDVAQKFLDWLEIDVRDIFNKYFKNRMIYGEKEEMEYNISDRCHICGKGGFDNEVEGLQKVRDHCHFTGKFTGAAHSKCNLQYRRPKYIPIIFHGMSNYDSHLFIKKLQGKNINVIAQTEEKYIAFNVLDLGTFEKDGQTINVKKELKFLDSFKFMASSLDLLSKNLDKEQHTHLQKHYQGRQLELLLRKGVYPYDYVNCIDKLSERSLPPKDKFYSRYLTKT